MKILHVLETSLPDMAGYSIRAKYIVENQKKHGIEPVVVTSPFFGHGRPELKKETIEGIPYYRTNFIRNPKGHRIKVMSHLVRYRMLQSYKDAVFRIAAAEKPDIIHAHSSYTNGYAANFAARKLKIPSIYEVRTLWGEAAVVEDRWSTASLKYKMVWQLELSAMRRADLVVAISDGIRSEIVSKGVPPEKVYVLPNGVDAGAFRPRETCLALVDRYGLRDNFVLGYIGSLRRLEGLEYLVRAILLLEEKKQKIKVLIVGDGPARSQLEGLTKDLGLSAVVFTGPVGHQEITDYYSVCDAMVFPRIKAKINERVTPLKPLEAMASGKVCLCSDVGGLTELVSDGKTGVVFRSEDPGDLADKLLGLMVNRERYETIRAQATEWVTKERDWPVLIDTYKNIYGAARQVA